MAINAANLQLRLSGGSGNSNPMLSLGGAMSSTVMTSQNTSALTNVTGVAINFCGNMTVGKSNSIRHTYTASVHTLELMDATDGTYGPVVDVSAGGTFFLAGSNRGSVAVTVTTGSLPLTSQVGYFTATNVKNNLFDDVAKLDALNGAVDYRCIYLYNTHATEAFLQVSVYGYAQDGNPAAAGDKFWVGSDPAGSGNGTTNAAVVIANENTAPAGVTFSSPVLASPLILGDIQPLECRAIWLRRNVPAALYAVTPDDYVAFGLKLIF